MTSAVDWPLRLLSRVRWTPQLIISIGLAIVSTTVLCTFRVMNPWQGAEHYYMREHRNVYRVMQACYVIIVASIGFNLRFAAIEVWSDVTGSNRLSSYKT